MRSIVVALWNLGDLLAALGKLIQNPQPQPVLVPVRVPARPARRRRRY